MTTGEGEADGGAIPPPRRPESGAPVPITLHSAGRFATALLDTGVPPWLRVPEPPTPRVRLQPVDAPRPPRPPAPVPPVAEPVRRPPSARPPSARPRVEPEAGIVGLSRLTRTRMGSRLFTLFFVAVFALIFVQMCVELLRG